MEDEGDVTVCVEVVHGVLDRVVELILSTGDTSAIANGMVEQPLLFLVVFQALALRYSVSFQALLNSKLYILLFLYLCISVFLVCLFTEDYVPTTGLIFSIYHHQCTCVTLMIIDDDVFEPSENFTIYLRTNDMGVSIDPLDSSRAVEIIDNEEAEIEIGFEETGYHVYESQMIEVCLELVNGNVPEGEVVRLFCSSSDITASSSEQPS